MLVVLLVTVGALVAWLARAPATPRVDATRVTPTAGDAAWRPPRPGLWVPLPAAPVVSRIAHAIAGRGDRVVVWGGFDAGGRPLDDGAVFDVGTGAWTRLPPADRLGGMSAQAVWVGDEVVTVSPTATRLHDVERRIWRDGPPLPLHDLEVLERLTATDDRVIALTGPAVGSARVRPGALVWTPGNRRWRRVPDPPAAAANGGVVVATGTRLVALRPASPRAPVAAAELDPSAGDAAWTTVAPPPATDRAVDRLVGVVADDRVVMFAADASGEAHYAVVRDRRATWRRIPVPPLTLTTDDDLLAVGRRAVLWDRRAGTGAVLDVPAGRWDRLPRSPAADGVPRPAVGAGPHLVTWGGLGPIGAVHRVP